MVRHLPMFCTSCTEDITILHSRINNRQGNQEKISFLIFSKATQLGQKLIYIVRFDSHVDQTQSETIQITSFI